MISNEAIAERPERDASTQTLLQRSQWIKAPLIAFLVTRAVIIGIVLLADVILPGFNDVHFYEDGLAPGFVNAWDRWDTIWYVEIAEQGYSYVPGAERNTVAFYPLYPLAMAALTPLVGDNPLVAGLLISNVSLLGALMILYRMVLLKTGDAKAASRAVFYIAAFPTAFFFSAVYTESLFLLLTVAAAYCAFRQRWLWASVIGMLAAATRATGFLLVLLVGWEWVMAQGWALRTIPLRACAQTVREKWLQLLLIALIPLGLLIYMAYLGATFGNPLAAVDAVGGWRQPSSLQSFLNDVGLLLAGKLWLSYIMDLAVFLIAMVLTIPIGRKFGIGYALYTAITLLIPASTGVMSLTRYATVLFPVFMILAVWVRSPRLDFALRTLFLVFLPLFTLAFVKNVFIG